MEFDVVGWPDEGPTLELDHPSFSYAGKFVMSNTGKAVARESGTIIAAAAFNEDRTDSDTIRLRYLTVRRGRRGEGVGPRLVSFVWSIVRDRGYERAKIAVNNPFAYQSMYRAGFSYTGERTGIAELVLERPGDRTDERYRSGLDVFLTRTDLNADERAFIDEKRTGGTPDLLD